jgi:hypothetical protein
VQAAVLTVDWLTGFARVLLLTAAAACFAAAVYYAEIEPALAGALLLAGFFAVDG